MPTASPPPTVADIGSFDAWIRRALLPALAGSLSAAQVQALIDASVPNASSNVVADGETLTIADEHFFVVASYIDVRGSGIIDIQGSGILDVIS